MSTTEDQTPAGSILSLLPGKGLVRVCGGGCVHVTYGIVTLDFHLREQFESLLVSLAEHPQQPQEPMHLRHGHALVSFAPEEFDEFTGMIRVAAEELRRLDTFRRLLDGISS